MIARLWTALKPILIGRSLTHAIGRNQRAADNLDAAIREVLQE